jgi:hypothetical protein
MKAFLIGAGAAVVLMTAAGTVAVAEQWVDYAPAKGVWSKTLVHVDPSRIDDYLVALKKTWVPAEESMKKHGLIDSYFVQVAVDSDTSGPNVLLGQHYVSMAALDPNKERDMAMQKEAEAAISKSAMAVEQGERAKYRTIVSTRMWTGVDFTK